ncbi:MAG: hypothetical protein JJT75_08850 [Opitutales bacterium]|nr:hypothetical protein [Opitutales bacterium]MCH8539691.1 hypothetical protein [Opitutales bacterium]
MYREILHHLRRKKFRLLSLWKERLEKAFPLDQWEGERPPPALLFRSLEECIRQLRRDHDPSETMAAPPIWSENTGFADQKMLLEIYLAGEEILGEFVLSEEPLQKAVGPENLREFLDTLFHTWHNLLLSQMGFSPTEVKKS